MEAIAVHLPTSLMTADLTPGAPQFWCNPPFSACPEQARDYDDRQDHGPVPRACGTDGLLASTHMEKKTTRRGNYESGSDYVLEYGELRFAFNEEDFGQRV